LNEFPDFSKSEKKMTSATILSTGIIEDCKDALQADFANAFIGGACISYGCVQEEILFSTNPECIVSRLFCQVMGDNEAIVIKGAEKFSSYKGYAFQLQYGGNFDDENVDENGNNLNQTVAMDAIIYSNRKNDQWRKSDIDRELGKSYVAFSKNELKKVATGNWVSFF
jgi:poly(ADP-ribose) glycohydrolase